ncbi:hypothetical protein O7A70_23405 [Mesorhizobium sp. Cs1299R1N1]|uniref:hypothetical protein n=1 Tax=Mesorhizobium sp. Cs1299R1N1 TaxID=3015172 RepID=UPI00301DF9B8
MAETERYDAFVVGSGEGGKYLASHLASTGQKTAVVERRWIDSEAGEAMAVVQAAMLARLPYTTLRDAIFTQQWRRV